MSIQVHTDYRLSLLRFTIWFLIFYKLFNFLNILMEALLALARPYGQTRTEELSSWRFLTEGRPIWSPLF